MRNKVLLIHSGHTPNITNNFLKIISHTYICEKYHIYDKYFKNNRKNMISKLFLFFNEAITLLTFLKNKKYKKIIVKVDSPDSVYYIVIPIILRLLNFNTDLIIFKYDIDNFRSYCSFKSFNTIVKNFILFLNKTAERYILINSDKIIHKGLENELEFLPFYEKIKDKPHYLFREFIAEDYILRDDELLPKLSEQDGKINIVYVGGIYYDNSFDTVGIKSYLKNFLQIVNHNKDIFIHIYPSRNDYQSSQEYSICLNHKQIIFHNSLPHKKLLIEITQYHYGIHWTEHNPKIINPVWTKTVFCNKIFDYIFKPAKAAPAGQPKTTEYKVRAVRYIDFGQAE